MNEQFGNAISVTLTYILIYLRQKNINLSLHRHVGYKDISCKMSDALYK